MGRQSLRGYLHRDLREGWRVALGVGRGQGGDGHQSKLSSPGCARGSQSHIKEMSQLVLNWEVSQAAVRTGMMRGALCGPKQGQILQRERTGFLGLPRKDLRYSGQAPGDGVGGMSSGPGAKSQSLVSSSRRGLLTLAWGCGLFTLEKLGGQGIISKGSHLGEGLGRRA